MDRNLLMKKYTDLLEAKGFSRSTIVIYTKWIRRFLDFVQVETPEEITLDVGQDYLVYLNKNMKMAASTLNGASRAVKCFFELVLLQPLDVFPMKRQPRQKIPYFTDEQAIELVYRCPNPMLKATIALGYGCGLRISEVICLKYEDFDSESMTISIDGSKNDVSRTVKYSSRIREVLNEYFRTAHHNRSWSPSGYLFPSPAGQNHLTPEAIGTRFREYLSRFPFYEPGMSFHTLRHSYATQMARKGVPITYIQQQMGHWNPMTTAHYIHLQPLSSKQKEKPLYVKRDRKNDQKEK